MLSSKSLTKVDPATNSGKARLVLADDNADMRDYVRRLLANEYEVEAVADGVAALAAVRRQPPDLLLADVMMPGLDGFALLHEIRADEKLKTLPVIMLSARAGEEAKIEGLDAGADEYLIKPFSTRELLARISAQLELARVRREAMNALRQRSEEFNAHFNLRAVGNVQADAKSGRLLLVNRAMGEMLGYSEAELLERTIWEITDPQDQAANELLFDELVRGERTSFELEKRFVRKDGETLWGLISVTIAQRDDEDNALRTGSVVLDITRRKRAEEEMRNLNETLEHRVEERTAQVRRSEADREQLARSLMMAEQVERRRISQILHDDLQQLLYATQMHFTILARELESIADKSLVDELNEAKIWLRQSIETTRQMTVDLSPPILRTEGFASALEWLQPQMEQRHGLKIIIDTEESFLREKIHLIDEDLSALLFQIVRELLFNVAKHAGVDHATVKLAREDNWMVIHVIDEGGGFDTQKIAERKEQKGSFGLFSVNERLNLVGGRMEVYSEPGAGTHIVIFAPVQTERHW